MLAALNLKEGMCFLRQCTTPFVSSDDLLKGVALLSNNQGATVVSGYVEPPHRWLPARPKNPRLVRFSTATQLDIHGGKIQTGYLRMVGFMVFTSKHFSN